VLLDQVGYCQQASGYLLVLIHQGIHLGCQLVCAVIIRVFRGLGKDVQNLLHLLIELPQGLEHNLKITILALPKLAYLLLELLYLLVGYYLVIIIGHLFTPFLIIAWLIPYLLPTAYLKVSLWLIVNPWHIIINPLRIACISRVLRADSICQQDSCPGMPHV